MRPILTLLILALGAPQALAAEDEVSVETGLETYQIFCKSCHGREGRGDGEFAELINIQPANLTRLTINAGGEFPILDVIRQIDGRDPVKGHSVIMPIFGPLFEGEVAFPATRAGQPIVTSKTIADLAAWIESIQETN